MVEERPRSRNPLLLLREPDFVRLWLTGGLTGTMRWLEMLALGLYAVQISDSALVVASLLFARQLPAVVFGAPMGVIASRVDRRRLLLGGVGALLLTSAVLAVLTWLGRATLWHLAIGAFVNGVVWSMEHPVRRTLLGEIAGVDRTGPAISLDSATFNATRMLGPLIGGVVFQLIGLHGAYVTGVVLYTASLSLLLGLRLVPRQVQSDGAALLSTLRAGFAYARRHRLVAGVLAVTALANFFGFAYTAMVPIIGTQTLRLDGAAVGALMSMEGVGALVGALTLAFVVRPRHFVRLYTGGIALFLVMILGFSASRSFPISALLLLAAGLGLSGFSAMQSTILLVACPEEMRTRMMGLLVMCIGAGPLGVLHVGALADWLGASQAIAVVSVEGLVCLAGAIVYWPELRKPGLGRPV